MYQSYPSLVLGFHGCDRAVGEDLLHGKKTFKESRNKYDWLGTGMYFWENAPDRAQNYAEEVKNKPEMGNIKDPFVIGAVIDLGRCFNLLDYKNLIILQNHYKVLKETYDTHNLVLPINSHGPERLLRFLDRAVIEFTHEMIGRDSESDAEMFDSVRAVFVEGGELYPSTGFNEKNHIQICVRNPNCIKGFFLPRFPNPDYRRV